VNSAGGGASSRTAAAKAVRVLWPWLSVALLALIIVERLPLTGASLLDATVALHTRPTTGAQMVHVFSAVQGRPTETCDTFAAAHEEMLRRVSAEVRTVDPQGSISGLIPTIKILDREIRKLFLSRPQDSCWREFGYYVYFQAGFSSDAPYIWVLRTLGLSTVHVALVLMLGSWAGLWCLFLIARRLSGSRLVGLATVVLNAVIWEYWQFPQATYIYILNCFVPLYLGMVLASPGPVLTSVRGWNGLADALLIGVFSLHALLQLFIYPFTHRVNGTLIVITVLLVGVLRFDKRVVLRGAALLVAVNLVAFPYYREMNGTYRQLTTQNLAASEGFAAGQMAWGLFERPTYLGLPNGDYGFTWMHAFDPYLYYTAPNLIVHQSFKHFGTTMMKEVLLTSPVTLISAVTKRVFVQTAYHHHLLFWWYQPPSGAATLRYAALMASLLMFAAGCIWSINRHRRWADWWPASAMIGWHFFGINTILTVVHVHDNYMMSGVVVLLTLIPALAIFIARDVVHQRRQPDAEPSLMTRLVARWPVRPWKTALAVAVLVLALAPIAVREARKEIDVFWLWFPIHLISNPFANFDHLLWRSPDDIAARVRHLESLGGAPPGRNDMYAAWVFWVYNYQNAVFRRGPGTNDPVAQERFKAQADAYMRTSYQAALQADPDNPNYASYALMINASNWPDIFRRAIEKWPTYHHAPYMAYHMLAQARSPEERARFVQVYEDGVGRLLSSSASDRPGYQTYPRLEPATVMWKRGTGGLDVTLGADEVILLDRIALETAPKIRIGLYVQVGQGQVQAAAVGESGEVVASCTQFAALVGDPSRYRYVDCSQLESVPSVRIRLKAVGPATVTLRDYYPLFSTVRSTPP